MRDKNFNPIKFFEQLEQHVTVVSTMCESLRKQVVDNPNFLTADTFLVLPDKLQEIEALALLSWWMPAEVRYLVQLGLEERIKKLSPDDQVITKILLSTKGEALLWLSETSVFHSRDFFGNFLRKGVLALQSLKFVQRKTKIVKPQRKRGYHDHGSLRPSHCWLPTSDWSLTEQQNFIEKKRLSFKDTIKFLRGLIS